MDKFVTTIAAIGYGIEAIGVLVILFGSLRAGINAIATRKAMDTNSRYRRFRTSLGRAIILGLEFLIAGDIIRTVIVEQTLANVTILALVILIRTFLSMMLFLETEGRFPWQEESAN